MATIVLCSATGSPGATVTALGLALTWPRDVLLLDADRTPSQSLLAGYLGGIATQDLGLTGLLQAHRERRALSEALLGQSTPLPEPPLPTSRGRQPLQVAPIRRRFVPGFAHLGSVDLFAGVWRELSLACAASPFDVIVDAGRIGVHGLPADLVDVADRIAVVSRTSLVSLAALRLYLGLITDQVDDDRVGLLLVGAGRPYGAGEVTAQFGVPTFAEIAWQPAAASELAEGQALGRRWRTQALGASYFAAAERLLDSIAAERTKVGVPA